MRDIEVKEQLSIRLPISIVDKIIQISEEEGKSINKVIVEVVERCFGGEKVR